MIRQAMSAVAATALLGGGLVVAAPAAQAASTISVTSADCTGPGSITEAVTTANGDPSQQWTVTIDVPVVNFVNCPLPPDRPDQAALRIESNVTIVGNNNSFIGQNLFIDGNGAIFPQGYATKCPEKGWDIVAVAPLLLDIRGGVTVTLQELKIQGLGGFGDVRSGSRLFLDKVQAREMYSVSTQDGCSAPLITAADGASITITDNVWTDMANVADAYYGSVMSPLILGIDAGRLEISDSVIQRFHAGGAVSWDGDAKDSSAVQIVSSRLIDSPSLGIRTTGETTVYLLNTLISPGVLAGQTDPTDGSDFIVHRSTGDFVIEASTVQFTDADCCASFNLDPDVDALIYAPRAFVLLKQSAVGIAFAEGAGPNAKKLFGDGGQTPVILDSGFWSINSWAQPSDAQDAAQLAAMFPGGTLSTTAPGLPTGPGVLFSSAQTFTSPLPNSTITGVIADADGANRLPANPITRKSITKDAWGNPRTYNGTRSLGAVEPQLAPVLSTGANGAIFGAVDTLWGGATRDTGALQAYALRWTKVSDTSWSQAQIKTVGKDTAFQVTGLEGGVPYKFQVYAIYGQGSAPEYSNVSVATPIAGITTPTLSVVPGATPGTLQASWTEPKWGSFPDEHKYLVQYRLKQNPELGWTNAGWTSSRTMTLKGLLQDSTYEVKVQAQGERDLLHSYLTPCDVKASPRPPCVSSAKTGYFISLTLTASPGDENVALAWFKGVDDTSTTAFRGTYEMQAGDGSFGAPTPWGPVDCVTVLCDTRIDSLTNGRTYRFTVEAVNGKATPATAVATPTGPAPAPQSLSMSYAPVSSPAGVAFVARPSTAPASAGGAFSVDRGLETWMSFDKASGTISGTPPASTIGKSYDVKVTWVAGRSFTSAIFTIAVTGNAPKIAYPDVASHVGETIAMTPKVSTIVQPVSGTFAITKGSLPAGLTFDKSTGVISGVAQAATSGPVSISVEYTDVSGSASAVFTIDVSAQVATLSASYPNIRGHVGQPVTATPTVTGATGTLNYTVTNGTLPAGLTLDAASGAISGTPTAPVATPVSIEVRVSDGSGSVVVGLTITIDPHTFDISYADVVTDVGAWTGAPATVVHALGSTTFSVTKGTLPDGLRMNSWNGAIVGIPTSATGGPVTIEVTATDQYATATASLTITVNALVDPAQATAVAVRDGEVVIAVGKTWGIAPGTLMTPMVRLSGQSGFTAGVPVEVLTDGQYIWTRFVNPTKAISVYFETPDGLQTMQTNLGKATISAAKDGRVNGRVKVSGNVQQIAAGQDVYPMVRIDGAKAVQGLPVTVNPDGTFTWSRSLRSGRSMSVVFVAQNARSNTLSWGS